jgi:hypothetical protein
VRNYPIGDCNILSNKRFNKNMKSIAVFLILNVLLLSSFTGMANIHRATAACRAAKVQKGCCTQQKKSADNDCGKGACNTMLSCGTCGFVITASVSIPPIISILGSQAVYPFPIGELSDYHGNDWNPPKV